MLQVIYPLSLEWTEHGAKHTVEWSFYGGQRPLIIEAIFRAIKEEKEGIKAMEFASLAQAFPDTPPWCPTCKRQAPKKNKKKEVT